MRIKGVSSNSKAVAVESIQQRRLDRSFESSSQRLSALGNIDKDDGKKEVMNHQAQMDMLIKAVDDTNRALEGYDRRFQISIHEGTRAVMVKVIDENTDEVIREIPPEKILDMVAALWEMAGIIVDRKV